MSGSCAPFSTATPNCWRWEKLVHDLTYARITAAGEPYVATEAIVRGEDCADPPLFSDTARQTFSEMAYRALALRLQQRQCPTMRLRGLRSLGIERPVSNFRERLAARTNARPVPQPGRPPNPLDEHIMEPDVLLWECKAVRL
jgi:hypothetical protein